MTDSNDWFQKSINSLSLNGIHHDSRHDDVDLETDEIGGEVREAIDPSVGVAKFDANVLTLDPFEGVETLPECLIPQRGVGRTEWR